MPAIKAPTLIIQGEDDTLFPLDQADANFRGLPADTPATMKWVAGGHDAEISVDALVDDLESWFGRYLKRDGSAADTSFSVLVPETSLLGEDRGTRDPETLLVQSYPGRGSELAVQRAALVGERQSIVAPPGGAPAALTNLPGTGGAFGRASSVAGYALGVLPGQSALFTSEPLTAPLTLIGSSRVDLEVTGTTPTATLFASLWDLGPDVERTENGRSSVGPSSAVLPQLDVAPVRLTGLDPGRAPASDGRAARGLPPGSGRPPPAGGDLHDRPGVRECGTGGRLRRHACRRSGCGDSAARYHGTERKHPGRAHSAAHCGGCAGRCFSHCWACSLAQTPRNSHRSRAWPVFHWS